MRPFNNPPGPRHAFTLVELLTATTITLMIMGAVVTLFAAISGGVSDSRATVEMTERLRSTALRLQEDLAGVTTVMDPPREPENDEGYFEYIEGPRMLGANATSVSNSAAIVPWVSDDPQADSKKHTPIDYTVGDNDDILMFTARNTIRPFSGRLGLGLDRTTGTRPAYVESPVAELAWFVRGRTLYRRVLLVAPQAYNFVRWAGQPKPLTSPPGPMGFYSYFDVSVYWNVGSRVLVENRLSDLTKRENRFAHVMDVNDPFPFDVRRWGQWGLPTLAETSCAGWRACNQELPNTNPTVLSAADYWSSPLSGYFNPPMMMPQVMTGVQKQILTISQGPPLTVNPQTGKGNDYQPSRLTEDVILTNVIGFDVKAWDPGAPVFESPMGKDANGRQLMMAILPGDPGYAHATGRPIAYGAYVDLGYDVPNTQSDPGAPKPYFAGPMHRKSHLTTNRTTPGYVYDTWSTHYNRGGLYGGQRFSGAGVNGFDDDGNGVIDDENEQDTMPPYPHPMRGIQVKIRTFEPSSRQIREVTVVQDFLPE